MVNAPANPVPRPADPLKACTLQLRAGACVGGPSLFGSPEACMESGLAPECCSTPSLSSPTFSSPTKCGSPLSIGSAAPDEAKAGSSSGDGGSADGGCTVAQEGPLVGGVETFGGRLRLCTAAAGGKGPAERFRDRRALAAALCKARQDILLSAFVTRPAKWSPIFNLLQASTWSVGSKGWWCVGPQQSNDL